MEVRCEVSVILIMLGLWSWSLVQFILVVTGTTKARTKMTEIYGSQGGSPVMVNHIFNLSFEINWKLGDRRRSRNDSLGIVLVQPRSVEYSDHSCSPGLPKTFQFEMSFQFLIRMGPFYRWGCTLSLEETLFIRRSCFSPSKMDLSWCWKLIGIFCVDFIDWLTFVVQVGCHCYD